MIKSLPVNGMRCEGERPGIALEPQVWSVEEYFAFNHAAARTPEAFLKIIG